MNGKKNYILNLNLQNGTTIKWRTSLQDIDLFTTCFVCHDNVINFLNQFLNIGSVISDFSIEYRDRNVNDVIYSKQRSIVTNTDGVYANIKNIIDTKELNSVNLNNNEGMVITKLRLLKNRNIPISERDQIKRELYDIIGPKKSYKSFRTIVILFSNCYEGNMPIFQNNKEEEINDEYRLTLLKNILQDQKIGMLINKTMSQSTDQQPTNVPTDTLTDEEIRLWEEVRAKNYPRRTSTKEEEFDQLSFVNYSDNLGDSNYGQK